MPMTCTVCRHEARDKIDLLLLSGDSERSIAQRFGLNAASVHRHKESHLPGTLVKEHREEASKQALDVLTQLRAINAVSLNILKQASDQKDGNLALRAVDRIQKQIELQAKLLGDLQQEGTVNVTVSPEWLSLRTVVVQALLPYPDAARAVALALEESP